MGYTTACWIWTGAIASGTGYGQAHVGEIPRRKIGAHRALYELHRGPIPAGLALDHLCRVRSCVNPDHLEPVTRAENDRRGAATKLTEDAVRAILTSNDSEKVLAARFGVSVPTIYNIRARRIWKDVS